MTGVTMKQMCEHIVLADIVHKKNGSRFEPKEIFDLSPTGELNHVFEWYELACSTLGYGADSDGVHPTREKNNDKTISNNN